MKKSYIFLPLALAVLILTVAWVNRKRQELSQPINLVETNQPVIMDNPELSKSPEKLAVTTEPAENDILPIRHLNTLVFTSQAPYAKWDKLHDEACEEASLIMAHYFLLNQIEIKMREAENEIQKMVTFQKSYFGSHKDLTAEEMIELAREFYSEDYQLIEFEQEKNHDEIEEITEIKSEGKIIASVEAEKTPNTEVLQAKVNWEEKIEYIKEELSKDNIFIIPVAGRELDNPYFRIPGPFYHVLVIIGYDDNKKEFITHDPGTRRGEEFHYSYEILWNAIHDFPGKKADILEGAKNIILVKK